MAQQKAKSKSEVTHCLWDWVLHGRYSKSCRWKKTHFADFFL